MTVHTRRRTVLQGAAAIAASAWMDGSASAGGAAEQFSFADNFSREDTAEGDLGRPTADDGVDAFPSRWTFVNGTAGRGGLILRRCYTAPLGVNCYAGQAVPRGHVTAVRARLRWRGDYADAPPSSAGAIILCPDVASWTDFALHLQVNPWYIEMDRIDPHLKIVPLAQIHFDRPPIPIGTEIVIGLSVDASGGFRFEAQGKAADGRDTAFAGQLGKSLLVQCGQSGAHHAIEWTGVRVWGQG